MTERLDEATPLFGGGPAPNAVHQHADRCNDAHNLYLPFDADHIFRAAGPTADHVSNFSDCTDKSGEPARRMETRTLTRYGLRLVSEGRVQYEHLIRCDQPETAARFLHHVLEGIDREVFGALYLDGRHQAIGHTIAYVGTLSQAPVEPRGVLVPALLANAAALILFHNHPSGDPDPSRDDEQLTRRLVDAGDVVGVKVLDHIILGEAPRYLSLYRRNPW